MGGQAADSRAERRRIGRAATLLTVGLMGPLLTCGAGGRPDWTTKSTGDSDPAVAVRPVPTDPQRPRFVAFIGADGRWFRVFAGSAGGRDGRNGRTWAVAVNTD